MQSFVRNIFLLSAKYTFLFLPILTVPLCPLSMLRSRSENIFGSFQRIYLVFARHKYSAPLTSPIFQRQALKISGQLRAPLKSNVYWTSSLNAKYPFFSCLISHVRCPLHRHDQYPSTLVRQRFLLGKHLLLLCQPT